MGKKITLALEPILDLVWGPKLRGCRLYKNGIGSNNRYCCYLLLDCQYERGRHSVDHRAGGDPGGYAALSQGEDARLALLRTLAGAAGLDRIGQVSESHC